VFAQAAKRIAARTKGNYPAPLAALRAVRTGYEHGIQAGYQAELAEFATLIESPEAAALMSIFFATQSLKDDPGIDSDAEPRPVEEIGVIGGGLMGGGIATVSILRAHRHTRIKEVDDAAVARGIGYVEKVLTKRRERGRLDADEQERLLGMLSGSTTWEGFASSDLLIEAVFEDLDLKRTVRTQAEEAAPEAIFASNTSSLPITSIAEGAARPEAVIGMHYFSPVEKMPLLEVIVTERTADWVTATCVEEGKRQGKHVIVVKDGPGFYTSRILAPYMIEVGRLLEEGVPIEDIDRAMVRWGFPVGPVTLTDEVGIDVGAKIAVIMQDAFGERLTPPALFRTLVDDGRKGRKNGRGFYRYDDGEKKGVDETVYEVLGITPNLPIPAEEIQERLALHMVNEAARCLEEGILRSARDGDVGAVFGLAFPPFRGGPFFWVDQVGASVVVERLERLAVRHGPRYEPAAVLRERADSGTPFRPRGG
jgi:3-hydroxyacyl-CoA dehydrogenase/enoyl-CoA hydratase/3-hydroxybutyryl-CoA epimerase